VLIIRDEQMRVFDRLMEERFRLKLRQRLCDLAAQGGFATGEEELSVYMEWAVQSANQFGLRRECDVARYAETLWLSRRETYRNLPRPALNILRAFRAEPSAKLDTLENWLARHPAGAAQ
jgi:hypothetical protein